MEDHVVTVKPFLVGIMPAVAQWSIQ